MLYTRVTQPLTVNFSKTPVGSRWISVQAHRFQEPVTGLGVSAEWESGLMKTAALQAGITNLYFADVQTLSILNGIYRRRTLIVYGD